MRGFSEANNEVELGPLSKVVQPPQQFPLKDNVIIPEPRGVPRQFITDELHALVVATPPLTRLNPPRSIEWVQVRRLTDAYLIREVGAATVRSGHDHKAVFQDAGTVA